MKKLSLLLVFLSVLFYFPGSSKAEPNMTQYRKACSQACGEQYSQQDPDIKNGNVVCYNEIQSIGNKNVCQKFGSNTEGADWCITHNSMTKNDMGSFQCVGLAQTASE